MNTNKQKLVTGLFLIVLGIIIMSVSQCQAQIKKVDTVKTKPVKIEFSNSEQNELLDIENQIKFTVKNYKTLDSLRQQFIRKKIYYSGYALNKVSSNGDSLQILPTSILLKLKK